MSQNLFAGRIEPIQLEDEIQRSYLDYAMSVIVGRALPDVRDGLKPVHRRILWSMLEQGLRPDRPYRKSANVVGGVMSKYHPHGDSAIYDALVRMAQDFSLRYPLVDPHGNFGSIDGDPAGASRYTEARLGRFAMEMLRDIDAETVDFVPNYDGYEQEPLVLPCAVPEPARQRVRRHRGRHGHEHPAAQPRRGDRRGRALPRRARGDHAGPHEVREGSRLPHRRHDHRQAGHRGRLPDRPRVHQGPRGLHGGGGHAGPREHRRDAAALPGEQGTPRGEDRASSSAPGSSRTSPTSRTTRAAARACGS